MKIKVSSKKYKNYILISIYINYILVFAFHNYKLDNGEYKYEFKGLNNCHYIDDYDIIYNRLEQ